MKCHSSREVSTCPTRLARTAAAVQPGSFNVAPFWLRPGYFLGIVIFYSERNCIRAWLCSYCLVMTCFLGTDNLMPTKALHSSLWEALHVACPWVALSGLTGRVANTLTSRVPKVMSSIPKQRVYGPSCWELWRSRYAWTRKQSEIINVCGALHQFSSRCRKAFLPLEFKNPASLPNSN